MSDYRFHSTYTECMTCGCNRHCLDHFRRVINLNICVECASEMIAESVLKKPNRLDMNAVLAAFDILGGNKDE